MIQAVSLDHVKNRLRYVLKNPSMFRSPFGGVAQRPPEWGAKTHRIMKSKVAIIYHKIDFDGICSYAVLRKSAELVGASVQPFPYNNGEPFNADLGGFDTVLIADICLPPELMMGLLAYKHQRTVWIDHHKTSIDLSVEYGFSEMEGVREIGKGACELAFDWAFGRAVSGSGVISRKAVEYLSCFDVWDKERYDWENEVLPFQYGMRNRYGLDADKFYANLDALLDPKEDIVGQITDEGRAILHYVRSSGRYACSAYGFEVTVGGKVKALCLMTAQFGSLPMEESARERGCQICMCVNRLRDGRFKISMFGNSELHLGDYLKEHYGGGGHAGAAGAVISEKQFLKLIRTSRI